MFDFKFDWDKSINIGIKEIDEQHQELFRIARDIEQFLLRQCEGISEDEVLNQLCELREYITYHFYIEEMIIAEINKDQLESHKKHHDEFIEVVNSIDCIELVKDPQKGLRAIKELIKEWLFGHILTEDITILEEK